LQNYNAESPNMTFINDMLMEGSGDMKRRKKFKEEDSSDDTKEEDSILLEEEEKEKARKRTRGPYRKSSSVGL